MKDGDENSIYEWESVSGGKFLIYGTSAGVLKVHDMEDYSFMWEKKICPQDIIFMFEIFLNFLLIFDMHGFYFFDFLSREVIKLPYPNKVTEDTIAWVHRLPYGNFLVQSESASKTFFHSLDFFSKIWENTFRWLFLGFLDGTSKFYDWKK